MSSLAHNLIRRPAALAAAGAVVVLGGGAWVAAQHSTRPAAAPRVHVFTTHWQADVPHPATPKVSSHVSANTDDTDKNCDVHITKTDPNSDTHVNCTSSRDADGTSTTVSNNVSITNVSHQSGTNNHSSNTTSVHITNE